MANQSLKIVVMVSLILLALTSGARRPAAQGRSQAALVLHTFKHDLSPSLDHIPPIPPDATRHGEIADHVELFPRFPSEAPLDKAVQTKTTSVSAASTGLGFPGVGAGINSSYTICCEPPDPNGSAGATQYVQWVNTSFAVFNKSTGALAYGPVAGSTLWSGFGAPCENTNSGDPVALYDKQAGRWVMMQPVWSSPYYLCVAVSTTSDATGNYNRYAYEISAVDGANFEPDYPKIAAWPDGYYISFNPASSTTVVGAAACALDRLAMLAGTAAKMICFQEPVSVPAPILPADLDGDTSAPGTTAAPPVGSPEYFMNLNSSANGLDVWKFHADFATPSNSTFTGPFPVANVAPFTQACNYDGGSCIPQAGTTQMLEANGGILMHRLAYRNFANASPAHEDLVVAQSVATGTGVTGVRWYDIQSLAGNPTAVQQGTYAPDSNHRWMASAAMDKFGDLALGYSVSGTNLYPAIRFTGRTPSDAANTLEGETSIIEGAGSQTSARWGDYTGMSVDPTDDCTFWYTNEYLPSTGSYNWSTRIASFKFPACAGGDPPGVTLSPASLTFASQAEGTSSASQAVTLTNGTSAPVKIYSVFASWSFTQTNNCGSSVAAGKSCTLNVSFAPKGTGTITGKLSVNAGGTTLTTALSGTGTASASSSVTLTPTALNFGTIKKGSASAPQNVTLNNGTAAAVPIYSVWVGWSYTQTNNCGTSVAAGKSCTLSVTFAPQGTGTINSNLVVNVGGTSHTTTLTGTGD